MAILDIFEFIKLYVEADEDIKSLVRQILEASQPHPESQE